MKLKYHKDWRGNFGDDLNLPFFEKYLNGNDRNYTIYGIGTLLNDVHGKIENSIIVGSGYGYGDKVDIDWDSTTVLGVRGPITANKLGLDIEEYVIGDPGLLVSQMPRYINSEPKVYKKVIALHHSTAELFNYFQKSSGEYYFLDPGLETLEDYISIIRDAEEIYTESLHGAIIASAFDKPFVAISMITELEEKKWLDFYQSVGIDKFDVIKVFTPKYPILRKIFISGKVRKFISPDKLGRTVKPLDLIKTINDIESKNAKNKLVRAESGKVKKLQSKIKSALNKLDNILL